MNETAVVFNRVNEEVLSVLLQGKWQLEQETPSREQIEGQIHESPAVKQIVFDATRLEAWDSSLLIFLFDLIQVARKGKIPIDNFVYRRIYHQSQGPGNPRIMPISHLKFSFGVFMCQPFCRLFF